MNNIQQLIEKYKAEWVKAKAATLYQTKGGYTKVNIRELGKQEAFTQILDDLTLLLKDTGASALSAHFANTMLGECAAEVETKNVNEVAGAMGETRAVGQNEQTKEHCIECGAELKIYEGNYCTKCLIDIIS